MWSPLARVPCRWNWHAKFPVWYPLSSCRSVSKRYSQLWGVNLNLFICLKSLSLSLFVLQMQFQHLLAAAPLCWCNFSVFATCCKASSYWHIKLFSTGTPEKYGQIICLHEALLVIIRTACYILVHILTHWLLLYLSPSNNFLAWF